MVYLYKKILITCNNHNHVVPLPVNALIRYSVLDIRRVPVPGTDIGYRTAPCRLLWKIFDAIEILSLNLLVI